jgi:hypothetical protein
MFSRVAAIFGALNEERGTHMTLIDEVRTIDTSNRLPELAARIRAEHEACIVALKRGLQHAVAAGKMLIEAKAALKHGEWLPWLRDHCQLPERTARRYMTIAPYAADQIGQIGRLADIEEPESLDEWIGCRLNSPFAEDDTEPYSLQWMATSCCIRFKWRIWFLSC